jgi:hypothetical protein
VAALLIAFGAAAASPAHAEGCVAPTSAMQQVELYFGSSVKGRPFVTEWVWSQFLASEVTPKSPDSLTVSGAHGQWRSGDGRIYREATTCSSFFTRPMRRRMGKLRRSMIPIRNSSTRKICLFGSTPPSAPLLMDRWLRCLVEGKEYEGESWRAIDDIGGRGSQRQRPKFNRTSRRSQQSSEFAT